MNDSASHVSSNKQAKWTREELEDLFYMSFSGYKISEICRELDRPRNSVLRALRRVQTQQALFNNIADVANAHNIDTRILEKKLKDPLYYIPLKKDEVYPIIILSTVIFGLVSMYGYVCYSP